MSDHDWMEWSDLLAQGAQLKQLAGLHEELGRLAELARSAQERSRVGGIEGKRLPLLGVCPALLQVPLIPPVSIRVR